MSRQFHPNWYRSEVHGLEAYDRAIRRHAWAAFFGVLAALAFVGLFAWMVR